MLLLDIDTLRSKREELAQPLGEIVIDHVIEYGRADVSFVRGQLYANDSRDVIDLMSIDEEVALQILAMTGASDEEMESHLIRRETRDLAKP